MTASLPAVRRKSATCPHRANPRHPVRPANAQVRSLSRTLHSPAIPTGALQHEHGQPGVVVLDLSVSDPAIAGSDTDKVSLLDPEADLHLHLEVRDLAVLELTAH